MFARQRGRGQRFWCCGCRAKAQPQPWWLCLERSLYYTMLWFPSPRVVRDQLSELLIARMLPAIACANGVNRAARDRCARSPGSNRTCACSLAETSSSALTMHSQQRFTDEVPNRHPYPSAAHVQSLGYPKRESNVRQEPCPRAEAKPVHPSYTFPCAGI
ncbi:hypothetical protein EJ02DRAFT_161010 [Clathrospora elynae]|uniref:Uncharacterized protein n=1 Tax=Clathrospora elynae TaxID=706981 RepID=A0A6A5SSG4_9PLEO|nr:hypothetical protein EJ02DRAFT_161010 [Clathrospora elynae]